MSFVAERTLDRPTDSSKSGVVAAVREGSWWGCPAGARSSSGSLAVNTKIVLRETGQQFSDRDDMADLIKRNQRALALHPSQATTGPDGSDAVKKILGGLTTLATGVAELRNRGYGAGHGPVTRPAGPRVRHARLTVNAATAWCQFMLDTLADPEAPWKKAETAAPEAPSA